MRIEEQGHFLGWAINSVEYPAMSSITEQFALAVAERPDACALSIGRSNSAQDAGLSYVELAQQSDALAQRLISSGVRPGDRVAFATRRDFDIVVAMLGILKAGAAYVPLDLSYPQRRLEFMLEDSGSRVVVVSEGLDTGLATNDLTFVPLDGAAPEAEVDLPAPAPEDPAYIIYTSGSTGTPKGVVTPHRAVLRLTKGATYTAFGPDRRILQMAPVSFDAATFEIWGTLLNGGTCVIYPDVGLPDFDNLRSVLAQERINTLWLTSSLFNSIIDADSGILSGLDELLVGGEALSVDHIRKALGAIPANIVNGYGPTETTTFACCYRIPRDLPDDIGSIPIGRPIENTAVAVLDDALTPLGEGQIGELAIAGDGLAIGYHNRPDMTEERFVTCDKAPGGRYYCTGDLVRMLCDGNIEYIGRKDTQVKIAGHRIELGEIENVLKSHPDVRNAAVTGDAPDGGVARIDAWFVPEEGRDAPDAATLLAYMKDRLPKYMVPSSLTPLEKLPLTVIGKLDRAALKVKRAARPSLEQAYVAPRGMLERFVAGAWSDLIGIDKVGRNDRFFELGGTSLMAMRFLEQLRRETGHKLSVAAFFDAPTVENIVRVLEQPAADDQTQKTTRKTAVAADDRIAIVGLGGRFAGAQDIPAFWDMLVAGRSGRIEITREDLIAVGEDPALLDDPDYVAAAFPLEDAEGFDAAFFGFTPREAQLMDPQQRILLETAWSALEDAGCDPRQSSDRVGVFAGVGRNAYLLNNLMSHKALRDTAADYNMLIGNERDFPSTHIAFRLGLRGPAMTVQTACSTSGVAIHLAAESLRRGECDMALAGGAKVLVPNRAGYHFVDGGPLAPDGFLRAFDAEAKGMVRGSGAAMVALKRLDDALADGDNIYAVMIASAINNDGEMKAGFTAPSVTGQAEVIAETHEKAGIDADSVSLIEAHGTGTILGDPIEVEGLTRAFARSGTGERRCALGSVKTNIGHLDAGATAAGLIKTALALKNEVIPPSLNYTTPNPRIAFESSPFYVVDKAQPWPRGDAPRRAGISSFGLGGTNAHLLVEEAPVQPASEPAKGPHLLVVSSRTDTALAKRCNDLADWLERNDDAHMGDVAHTLRAGRRRFEKRLAVLCENRSDAIEKLRAQHPRDLLRTGLVADAPPVAFLFPGGGAQYAGMAEGLYDAWPAFRTAMDACNAHFEAQTGTSLIELIKDTENTLENPSTALPALFAVEYAMAQLWLSWGVSPAAMIGHSMGEYSAACVSGVMSMQDAMDIVLCRGRLFETLDAGSMLSVPRPEKDVTPHLTPELSVAAINRPDQCVIAGPVKAIEALAETLAGEGIETRRVHINVAAHSTMVEPILKEFGDQVRKSTLNAPQIPFLSNVTGDWITDDEATDPDYWVRHLRGTVRFSDGIERLLEDPERIFMEIGPGQTLSSFARQHPARGAGHEVFATLRHPQETVADDTFLLGALGRYWMAGGTADWRATSSSARRKVSLPTYPFERKRAWIDAVPFADSGDSAPVQTEAVDVTADAVATPDADATPLSRRERIMAQLKAIISQLSGLPADQIDEYATFLELGFDSLFLTQANAAFKKAFKVRMTTRQLLETTPGLDLLAEHLDATLPEDTVIGAVAAPSAPTTKGSGAAKILESDSPGRPTVKKTVSRDLTPEQEDHIDALIASTNARTPKAKESTQKSRKVLADPRTVQGFKSRWKEMVYPILSDKAKGSKVWDIDGNEYIDLVGGYGVTMFGHQPQFVVDAVRGQLEKSLAIGPQSVLAGEVAELVSDMTGMERVAFCNTGSEAVLAAVRMARTYTGKSKVAKFDGHYHGIFDEMQVRGAGEGSRKTTLPSAPGIPAEAIQNTIILDYGDDDAFNVIREQADEIALVLVEPVRSRNPDYQPREYLHQLRKLTEELGIPLLFDEIVTGFRSHPGGAQAIFDVRADIATYGKVAGGGLPIGIVAGKPEYMDTLDGGSWQFGDDSVPTSDMTWFAGTFVRHPMALAATKATLEHMKSQGPALQEGLNARGAKLAADLNAIIDRLSVPIKVEQFASVLRLTFTEHQENADLLFFHLRNRGIMTYEGRPIFLTTAHSDEDYARVVQAFEDSLKALVHVGLLDGRDPEAKRIIPMAIGQQEIWISSQFSTEASCSYNLCSTLKFKGDMDAAMMQAALNDLGARHEALRSVPDREGLTQTILPEIDVPLEQHDLRDLCPQRQAAAIEGARQSEVKTPFDLVNGPLVRAKLLRLTDDKHFFLLTVHHVIADGWSCGVLLRDLGKLYAAHKAGAENPLEPTQQLSDFVFFQRDPEQKETRKEARDYWLDLYGSTFPRIDFPSDRPRPKDRDYSAKRIEIQLPRDLVDGLRRVALKSGTTLFASLIGGFAAYVTRITGVADNPIGFSAAGQPLLGGGSLVGHCVNFLPLRLSTDLEQGFGAHLKGIGASVLDALEHQNFDFVSFVQEIRPSRDADWAPLVSIGVNLDPSAKAMEFADFGVEAGSVGRAYENLDLFLNFVETGSDVELQCTFNRALFDQSTIERRMGEYLRLLSAGATTPEVPVGDLKLLEAEPDTGAAMSAETGTGDYRRDASVIDRFALMVKAHGNKPAVILADGSEGDGLSYAELDSLSDTWAARLAAEGVGKGDSVAVMLPRSVDFIVAILAVLKRGAIFVPIDPSTPAARVQFLLSDSGAKAILSQSDLAPADCGVSVLEMDREVSDVASAKVVAVGGSDPAYIMYTSGSTGTPKGVVVPHRAIARLVLETDYARLDDSRVIAQLAPTSFDASTFETWGALLNGGTLAIVPGTGLPELSRLGEMFARSNVTTLWLTAALFNAIVDENPEILNGIDELLTGGEALSVPHVIRAFAALPDTTLINGYGPTENTTFSCCYRIPRDLDPHAKSVPIGTPIAHTQAIIVDARLQPVPPGIPGELVVAGDGLAIGYWNQEELTQASFVQETDGARYYKTGDICRKLDDGTIEYLGRRDGQVKIRGFRIEPGEIEAALSEIDGVGMAAVVCEPVGDSVRLIAFAVCTDASLTPARLKKILRDDLPRHMVPSRVLCLPELPTTANGKLNRDALLQIAAETTETVKSATAETATEKQLVALWSDILQVPVNSVEQSFFDLGGHSLMAVRLFDRIARQFHVDMPISVLFTHPNIRDLAEVIDQKSGPAQGAATGPDAPWDTSIVIHPGPEGNIRPLFIVGGAGGNVNNLADLGRAVGQHRPLIGFQSRGILDHTPRDTIEEIAAEHIQYLRKHQAVGPYLLAGYSAGALTAFEMARQLSAAGQTVSELILLDTFAPGFAKSAGGDDPFAMPLKLTPMQRLRDEWEQLRDYGFEHLRERIGAKLASKLYRGRLQSVMSRFRPIETRSQAATAAWFRAARKYEGGHYDGDASLVLSKPIGMRAKLLLRDHPQLGWSRVITPSRLECILIDTDHLDMVQGPRATELAEFFEQRIARADAKS
ncbi:amino acid adenylation domain-containing protein [Arenibacterium sp. CAU 1754]